MKKRVGVLAIIIAIYVIAAVTKSKFISAAEEKQSEEIYQTWEEFLESGVKIKYGETSVIMDNIND